MEKICELTQESIALGVELLTHEQKHIKTCEKCSLLLTEYEALALLVSNSTEFEVPSEFADMVMSKIEMEDNKATNDWMENIVSRFERLMTIPQTQYLVLGIGGAISLLNLTRFVFFILIPVQ